jgi:hypothetical protein
VVLFVLMGLVPRDGYAAGEISGRVSGYVYDPTGAPLGMVPLTLRSHALMQTLERTSDDSGKFEFPSLPPADDYLLEVNIPGFKPVKKGGIGVALGQTTPIDVHLVVGNESGQEAATFEIVEKVNPALNPDSAQTSAVVTHEKAESTPVFHQVQAMSSQVAGVGPGSTPSVLGGLARWGKYYVDGLDTTDITDGSFTAPMNFDIVENFEIITGGFDAQYNSMGLIQNMVTKNGSNKFEYDANLTWSPPAFNASTKVQNGQPYINQELTNSPTGIPQSSYFQPVFNLGGPIIPDKLWFYASGQLNRSVRSNLISNYYESDLRTTMTWTELARLKLTWQASDKDLVSFAVNLDHNAITNGDGSIYTTPTGEYQISRGGYFLILNYNHTFSDSLLFQLQAGETTKRADQDPMVEGVSHSDIINQVTQASSGPVNSVTPGNFLHESKTRFQFDPSMSLKVDTHQFKWGLQTSLMLDEQIQGVTDTLSYRDKGGVCDPSNPSTFAYCYQRISSYNTTGLASPLDNTANAFQVAAFIQDRWSVSRRLTLIPGIRVDTGFIFNQAGYVTQMTGVGPRLSFTYDVNGDRKTLITAHYGRANDVGNIYVAQFANPTLTQVTSTFTNGTFPTCSIGQSTPGCTSSGGQRLMTQNPVPPHVDEVSAGFRTEVLPATVVGIDAAWRYYSNLWAEQETNRIYDFTGTRVLGYVNPQNPMSVVMGIKPGSAYREYAGGSLWVQGTPGNWDILASYTLGFNWGTVDDYFDGYMLNPRFTQFYQGYVSDDRRHTLKGSITYKTDWGLSLGARTTYYTGSPLWESFVNPTTGAGTVYRTPRGMGFSNTAGVQNLNDPTTWTELRNPDYFNIDFLVNYNLGKALGMKETKLEVMGFVFNALNNSYATALSAASGRTFGLSSAHASPLQVELLIRLRN